MGVLTYEVTGRVAEITLNRPERLNALNDDLLFALRDGLYQFDEDDRADVAILKGEGRAFCSGADVRELQLRPMEEVRRLGGVQPRDAQIRDLLFRFTNWKPIIAAVHGYAIGGGLHLALLCDVIVAEEGCMFQVAETARGADPSVLWALLRSRSTEAFATEVCLTARKWSSEDGYRAGLVSRIAPDGATRDVAVALAEEIRANPSVSTSIMVKRRRALIEAVEVEAHALRDTRMQLGDAYRESARSFLGEEEEEG